MKTEETMMKAQFECYQKFIQVPGHENTGKRVLLLCYQYEYNFN